MERPPESLDLERLGLGTYTKLTLDDHDVETIEIDELVEQYGIPVSASTIEQTGVMPPRSDAPWSGDDCVNLSQCAAPVPDGYSLKLLLDLGVLDRRKMQRMEGMDIVDSLIGIGLEVDASEAAGTAVAFAVRSSQTAAKRQRVA